MDMNFSEGKVEICEVNRITEEMFVAKFIIISRLSWIGSDPNISFLFHTPNKRRDFYFEVKTSSTASVPPSSSQTLNPFQSDIHGGQL